MFLCISANPAIDKRLRVTKLHVGAVNRATEVEPEPGGKAAHVAMALHALGAEPEWIGFAGGLSGRELIVGLTELGINPQAIPTQQTTRVNLAIHDDSGTVTEILEPGGAPSPAELNLFRKICEESFARGKADATVLLSGSLPPGLPDEFYAELIRSARGQGCRIFLDASGKALRLALEQRPDFVKPNREEAEWLTGIVIQDIRSAREAVRQILSLGARSVALSLGKEGLIWCPGETQHVFFARPPAIEARSAVGSGDCTVAGFAQAITGQLTPEQTVRRATACGTANCLVKSPGQIRLSDVQEIEKSIRVETLP
jgi:1-phosphofructokinase family hexose kinase